MSLEAGGVHASRPYIEAARPEHPSLLDPEHQLDALFGVVNIPNVIWIDESGVIVRPPEPGWPGPTVYPEWMQKRLAERARQAAEQAANDGAQAATTRPGRNEVLQSGQDRAIYPDAMRDWARNGPASEFAMTPDQVIAASQPRSTGASEAAARFDLANHLWRLDKRDAAIAQFDECHRLQPENWTYKRQAWSLVGRERVEGEVGLFNQGPLPGDDADWPFATTFDGDLAKLGLGEYYPKTL